MSTNDPDLAKRKLLESASLVGIGSLLLLHQTGQPPDSGEHPLTLQLAEIIAEGGSCRMVKANGVASEPPLTWTLGSQMGLSPQKLERSAVFHLPTYVTGRLY
ncbi:hypothetical protein FF011L_54520 [Roseimaritima multifibrata]|uniref:Uncharacterized protein n=1 Tax=Roseimaritima multifibrata TaxID=1930274 RepID=A0A517MP35_9BACT|nr:hypothetical protein FF011L_54520 [Roseimaritima multifibrata]